LEYFRPDTCRKDSLTLADQRFFPNPDDVALSRKLIQWCRRKENEEA